MPNDPMPPRGGQFGTRRPSRVAAAAAIAAGLLGALLNGTAMAQGQSPPPRYSDQFNTSSDWYGTPRANQELKHWRQLAAPNDEFRTQTEHCLKILDEVSAHEAEAKQLKEQAGQHRGDPSYAQFHRAAGREQQIAAQLVAKFWKCASPGGVQRADRFDTQGEPGGQGDRFGSQGVPNPVPPQSTAQTPRTPGQGPFDPNLRRQYPTADGGDRDCLPEPDASTRQRLRKTGIEVIDTMAAMGQQADRTLSAMGQAVAAQLAYLAQPNARIWQDRKAAVKAVVEYMANDNARNHETLRKSAEAAAQQFLRDPSGALGREAGNILVGKVVQTTGGICPATATKLKVAVTEHAKAEKAAGRLKVALDAEKRQLDGPRNLCVGSTNRVNPEGRKNSCVPASWADELSDETGFPFDERNFRWTQADDGTPWPQIYAVQKQMWGDRRFGTQDPTRATLQSLGIPALMPEGMKSIVDELRTAGNGAGGLVITVRQNGASHMFRAKNFGGTVKFRDPALNTGGSYNFMPEFHASPLRSVFFYRTTGPDMQPR